MSKDKESINTVYAQSLFAEQIKTKCKSTKSINAGAKDGAGKQLKAELSSSKTRQA